VAVAKQQNSPVARWQALSSAYAQACELDAGARRELLDRLRTRDAALHEQLLRMLASRDRAGDADSVGRPPRVSPPERGRTRAGTRVGPYKLIRRLGAGSLAEVWLGARADGAFRRQVAVKLLSGHVGDSRDALARRFDRERGTLASLRHPHIAGLIDAGVTDRGEAWLALDHVDGEPIDAWCDRRRLPLRERMQLFRQLLLAVQHAHAHLVIHRDLKPANILVTARGELRLLDVGIARLLGGDAPADAALARPGAAPAPPRYASPEQLTGAPLTTACDVYALGVVLYELLCGSGPYELKVETAVAVEQAIVDAAPRAPSRRAISDEAARARGTTPRRLQRVLAGELDALVLGCLGKTPAARYSSVDALLADVDRWLAGVPVLARAPSAWLRLAKFAARHRLAVGLGAAAVIALASTAGVAVMLGVQARQESARATAAREFMVGLFQRADDEKSRGADSTARELLDAGRRDVVARLAGRPALQAELLSDIARIQAGLGEHAAAFATHGERVRLHAAARDPHLRALALAEQAMAAVQMNDPARAEALASDARDAHPAADAELDARLALVDGWVALGQGDAAQALERFDQSRRVAAIAFGESDRLAIEPIRGSVAAQRRLGRFARAVELQERLAVLAARHPGFTARDRAAIEFDRIGLLYAAGRFAAVVAASGEAVARCDRLLGRDHATCRRIELGRVQALLRTGAVAAARAEERRVAAIADDRNSPSVAAEAMVVAFRIDAGGEDAGWAGRLRSFGESGVETAAGLESRALALAALAEAGLRRARPDAAARDVARGLALLGGGRDGRGSASRGRLRLLDGVAMLQRGSPAAALEVLRAAQLDFAAALGTEHPLTRLAALDVAVALQALGRRDEALALVREAEPGVTEAFGADAPTTAQVLRLRRAIEAGERLDPVEFFV
jgi:serine/threonine-protein kinase